MTGFAQGRCLVDDGEVSISIKSVNHRGLDMHFRMSSQFDALEPLFRQAIRTKVARGHIQVSVSWTKEPKSALPALNKPLLEAYLAAFREAQTYEGIAGSPELNAALQIPGMLAAAPAPELEEEVSRRVLDEFSVTLDRLNEFRAREGAELAGEIRALNASLRERATQMEALRREALPQFQARLQERLSELLRGAGVEPQRLAQEAAILADRSDIAEELTRLQIHSRQLDELLSEGVEVGRRIDFLLQEMNRETNTALSKTNGVGELGLKITELALGAKADIEKMREQTLNLE